MRLISEANINKIKALGPQSAKNNRDLKKKSAGMRGYMGVLLYRAEGKGGKA